MISHHDHHHCYHYHYHLCRQHHFIIRVLKLTSSTKLQTRSFHAVERTRTSSKCQKKKNGRAMRAKILFFIVKYANLWGFCCCRRRGCLSSLLYAHGIIDGVSGVSGVSKCQTICFLPIKQPKLHNFYSPVKQIFILLNMFIIRGLVFLS